MVFTSDTFDLRGCSDGEVTRFLTSNNIGLTLEEARHLQFGILKRPPSLAEFVLFGIEGSEHCSYKSSRVHLKQFVSDGDEVVLGAAEDAGVVRVARDREGRGYCAVVSHESHNHPSQIVPFEGAATGVGGNVRDICCMGAEVVALADDLRFGDIADAGSKWIYEGVVSGVAGYGNPIGVPSLAGGLQFDPGYKDNCLVTVVTLGILREDRIIHSYAPENADGYDMILVGKPTDRSGFGGASFASFELNEDDREQNKGAVQEPNAFLGRHLIQASTALVRKLAEANECDRVGCKDLGAGGIACAAVEIADTAGYGAVISLDAVHTEQQQLPPHVVLCSETQERYLWVVPEDLSETVLDHFNRDYALPHVSRGARACVIGKITDDPVFRVTSGDEIIVDAPAPEVTRGFLYHRPWTDPPADPARGVCPVEAAGEAAMLLRRWVAAGGEDTVESSRTDAPDYSLEGTPHNSSKEVVHGSLEATPDSSLETALGDAVGAMLRRLLAHENVACRAPLYERYDKQVQGRVLVEAGEADCGIMTPFNDESWPEEIRTTGITLTTDQNPRMNRRDPYLGATMAVVESYCNTVAVGAEPIALSDCLCYGNPEKADQMGQFVAGCRGVADAAGELGLPLIAGNVSFYNESASTSIPPSPMIACLGRLSDAGSYVPGAFQAPCSPVFLLGNRTGSWGGSVFEDVLRRETAPDVAAPLPEVNLTELKACASVLREAARTALIRSCHDIAEGGLAVALCEMTFRNGIGCTVEVELPHGVASLFEETPGFIIEAAENRVSDFLNVCDAYRLHPIRLGATNGEGLIRMVPSLEIPLADARDRWETGFREKLMVKNR